jgi:hypothetical protein
MSIKGRVYSRPACQRSATEGVQFIEDLVLAVIADRVTAPVAPARSRSTSPRPSVTLLTRLCSSVLASVRGPPRDGGAEVDPTASHAVAHPDDMRGRLPSWCPVGAFRVALGRRSPTTYRSDERGILGR